MKNKLAPSETEDRPGGLDTAQVASGAGPTVNYRNFVLASRDPRILYLFGRGASRQYPQQEYGLFKQSPNKITRVISNLHYLVEKSDF